MTGHDPEQDDRWTKKSSTQSKPQVAFINLVESLERWVAESFNLDSPLVK